MYRNVLSLNSSPGRMMVGNQQHADRPSGRRPRLALSWVFISLSVMLAACDEPDPPTQSQSVILPWQFHIAFSVEDDGGDSYTARARLYDIAQAFDVAGNMGTIQLSNGDAVFADGIALDIETHTEHLGTLRVDYSQSLPKQEDKDEYLFELRRANGERIEGLIPVPEPFTVDEIGAVEAPSLQPFKAITLSWTPRVEDATIDIAILPLTEHCLTVIGGGAGDVVKALPDEGTYDFETNVYHVTDHDCSYELILTRRTARTVSGRWLTPQGELPSNALRAIGVQTVRKHFVALKR